MLIIDRFEGNYAVVEADSKMENILRTDISPDAKEGDVICLINGKYVVDVNRTESRRNEIEELSKDLWGD